MIHHRAAVGYEQNASIYATARPGYHPDLVSAIIAEYGTEPVVELGAGTGIFTNQLVAAGCRPIALEPVDAMRARLRQALPTVTTVAGTAESTGLPAGGAATVIAAQSFHWFDHGNALGEIARILRPGGHLVTVWNVRDETVPWVSAYTEVMDRYAGDTPRYRQMTWRSAIDRDPRFDFVNERAMPNPWPTTPDGVVGRALSTSFIAALPADEQARVEHELLEIVAGLGDHFDYPYRSEFQAWTLSVSSLDDRMLST